MTPEQRTADNRLRRVRRKRAHRAALASVPWDRVVGKLGKPITLLHQGTPVTLVPTDDAPRGDVLLYAEGTPFIVGLTEYGRRRGWSVPPREVT